MRKFTESIANLSNETVKEYRTYLNDFAREQLVNLEKINDIKENIQNYTSNDVDSNDQIDNAVFELDYMIDGLNNMMKNLDKLNVLFTSYIDDGRKNM